MMVDEDEEKKTLSEEGGGVEEEDQAAAVVVVDENYEDLSEAEECRDRNMTPSPVTPILNTPSPASLSGATRLVLGSSNHLGEGGSLQLLKATSHSNNDEDEDELMQQVSLGSTSIESDCVVVKPKFMNGTRNKQQHHATTTTIHLGQPPAFTNLKNNNNTNTNHRSSSSTDHPTKLVSFTRLCDLRDTASLEEIPFDERPKHVPHSPPSTLVTNQSMSTLSSSRTPVSLDEVMTLNSDAGIASLDSGLIAVVPSSGAHAEESNKSDDISSTESKSSAEYSDVLDNVLSAPDVLAQFSDAALFGDPTQAVSDFMSDIVGSAKNAVSNLVLQHKGRRNEIDDSGPIRIGDKYYTHNEALHLWRKAKDKLLDKHGDVDNVGNVKIERASFFEKNTVFQEKEDEKHEKKKKSIKREDGEMTLNELITRYKMFEKKSRSADESTEAAANIGSKDEVVRAAENNKKTMMALMPVNEEKVTETPSEFRGFDVDNETAETESETNCSGSMNTGSLDTYSHTTRSGDETSDSSGGSGCDNRVNPDLNGAVQLSRGRAMATTPAALSSGDNKKMLTNNNNETDSVAGKDSLPSHMGSAYGVEVTSGMSCKFINGKSTTTTGGGKSGMMPSQGNNCEQSVLGSQYGTEVLFKPKKKKVITGRKSRTLASHNMSVKKTSIKQSTNNTAVGINVNTAKQQMKQQGSIVKKDEGATSSLPASKSTQHRTLLKLQKTKKPLLSKLGMSKKVNVR